MSTVAFSTSEAIQFLCISVESENIVVSLRLLTTDIRSKLRLEIAVKEFYHSRLFVSQNGLKFFSLAWTCLLVLAFTKTDIKPALGWFSNTPKQRKKISFQRSGLFFIVAFRPVHWASYTLRLVVLLMTTVFLCCGLLPAFVPGALNFGRCCRVLQQLKACCCSCCCWLLLRVFLLLVYKAELPAAPHLVSGSFFSSFMASDTIAVAESVSNFPLVSFCSQYYKLSCLQLLLFQIVEWEGGLCKRSVWSWSINNVCSSIVIELSIHG